MKEYHQLLVPGILAELELTRHIALVESMIVAVETKIFELDTQGGAMRNLTVQQLNSRREKKRSTWLNLSYLRNSITIWNNQIEKMSRHAQNMNRHPAGGACEKTSMTESWESEDTLNSFSGSNVVGEMIHNRLKAIHEEYEDKIRDCTMRLDGMAMATQWSHGELAVETAEATNRESRVMKSISLVTMVFLPGTFFAVSHKNRAFVFTIYSNIPIDGILYGLFQLGRCTR